MRRRWLVAGAVGVVVLALSGCSVPPTFGMRLNADGTIDYVECESSTYDIAVDYLRPGEDENSFAPEWIARGQSDDQLVVRYGEAPDGFETTVLEAPPADWVSVEVTTWIWVDRDELVEGEWEWWGTKMYPWDPDDRPCSGIAADDLED